MYKIAVLGDRDSVLGFKALGLDIVPTEGVEEGRQALHKLAKEEYAIIYVTEQLAQSIRADIDKYKTSVTPAVILIPGKGGSLGLGAQALPFKERLPARGTRSNGTFCKFAPRRVSRAERPLNEKQSPCRAKRGRHKSL